MPMRRSTAEDFWGRTVETKGGCVEYIQPRGGKGVNGYPQLSFVAATGVMRPFGAHRIAWALTYGRMPSRHLHHKCENKRCVNVAHLVEVTFEEHYRLHFQPGCQIHGLENYRPRTERLKGCCRICDSARNRRNRRRSVSLV